jgi:hypothetical protein
MILSSVPKKKNESCDVPDGIWMDSGCEKGVMQLYGAMAKISNLDSRGLYMALYHNPYIIHYYTLLYTIFIHILPCYLMFFPVPHHLHHLVAHHIHPAQGCLGRDCGEMGRLPTT